MRFQDEIATTVLTKNARKVTPGGIVKATLTQNQFQYFKTNNGALEWSGAKVTYNLTGNLGIEFQGVPYVKPAPRVKPVAPAYDPTKIETTTCGRCGGCGKYSFNQISGSTCFGCGGSGVKFTKRGALANQKLIELRSKPLSEIKVGDLIRYEFTLIQGSGVATVRAFATVTEIRPVTEQENSGTSYVNGVLQPRPEGRLYYAVESKKWGSAATCGASPTELIRVGCTAEQKAETLKQALAYQATLSRNGKLLGKGKNP